MGLVFIHAAAVAVCILVAFLCTLMARTQGFASYRLLVLVASGAAVRGIAETVRFWPSQDPMIAAWCMKLTTALGLVICAVWLVFDTRQKARMRSHIDTALMVLLLWGAFLALIPKLRLGDGSLLLSAVLGAGMLKIASNHFCSPTEGNSRDCFRLFGICLWIVAETLDVISAHGFVDIPQAGLGTLALMMALFFVALQLAEHAAQNATHLHSTHEDLRERIGRRTKDLVLAREALMAAERHTALGRLAAGVGHEINNPLSYVGGNLLFIRETLEERKGQQENLAAIADAMEGVERICTIVENLTVYARSTPASGQSSDVARAIDVARRMVAPRTRFLMAIEVTQEEPLEVTIGETRLIQVLVNLLLNAAQACEPRAQQSPMPVSHIRCMREADLVRIEIQDHGSGMSPETVQRAFVPLFTTRDLGSGTGLGLGLFVCHGIITAAGGSIEIDTELGVGTSVHLLLKPADSALQPVDKVAAPRSQRPSQVTPL